MKKFSYLRKRKIDSPILRDLPLHQAKLSNVIPLKVYTHKIDNTNVSRIRMRNDGISIETTSTQDSLKMIPNYTNFFKSSGIILKKLASLKIIPQNIENKIDKIDNKTRNFIALNCHKLKIKQLNPLNNYLKPCDEKSNV